MVIIKVIQKREIILMDDGSFDMDFFWNLIGFRKVWIQRCSSVTRIRTIWYVLFDSRSQVNRYRRRSFIIVIMTRVKSGGDLILESKSISEIRFFKGFGRLT